MLANSTMSRMMNDIVANAVSEMRRYYSRKVVDVLVKVTKQSVDELRRKFDINSGIMFNLFCLLLHSIILL